MLSPTTSGATVFTTAPVNRIITKSSNINTLIILSYAIKAVSSSIIVLVAVNTSLPVPKLP